MAQWFLSGQFHCLIERIIVFIIKFHGISSNHELVVYAWLPCACKCLCMRSTRTPFLTTSHELIFKLMGLTISLWRANMICLQMKCSRLSTLLHVVSNMEINIMNNITTQLSSNVEGELGKPWPKIGAIWWTNVTTKLFWVLGKQLSPNVEKYGRPLIMNPNSKQACKWNSTNN